ncbi:MAG TPA: hypothetical protein VK601_27540, partial [Kofleriaceae bacterium]|nr:hypothetical protein [Kofleriaceae bacterium]
MGLTACGALKTSTVANFAEPATRAARLLPASPPAFISEAWPGASLDDALVVDSDLLLDLSTEHVEGYATRRACGPLVRLDPRAGTTRWQLAREGTCATPLALVGA